jgi:hypothetical protein
LLLRNAADKIVDENVKNTECNIVKKEIDI